MPTQTGTILVTGANGGLGTAIAGHVLSDASLAKTLHGLYAVRSVERASAIQKVLSTASSVGHEHDLVPLDLASLASVRAAAADINGRVAAGSVPPIRALVLCAGWQEYTTQTLTDDGFDMAFQANYLSHFLLALLLLRSMDREKGRIVILGSWTHDPTDKRNTAGPTGKAFSYEQYNEIFKQPMDTEALARGRWSPAEEDPGNGESGFRRYGASKMCQVMNMRELARRVASDPELSSVAVLGLDPGAMASGLGARGPLAIRLIFNLMMPLMNPIMTYLQPNGDLRTTWKSGGDVVRAAFGNDPNGVYMNGSQVGDVGPEVKDEVKCRRLWSDSLGLAGVEEGDTVLADWR